MHSLRDRLKTRQCQLTFYPDLIPEELARSNQWVVWSYEVSKQYEGLFRINKQPYQLMASHNKISRVDASEWTNLEDALRCWKENVHIDGIGYMFAKGDGLIGIDLDNCRNPYTGKIKKEYLYWIKKIDSYAEVSPSGAGVKIWVKGVVAEDCFLSVDASGFRILNYASGEVEIYRNGQFFTVTTQIINGFDSIREAQVELDVICAFSLSHTQWDFIYSSYDDGNIDFDELVNRELSLLQSYADDVNMAFSNEMSADKPPFIEEKSASFEPRRSQIQQFCEDRKIETLVHFTRIENLDSILQLGLVGQSLLQTRKQQFLWNDADRADLHPEAICLSISFPNYQMFYSIREQYKSEGVYDFQWVVLLIEAKVLWELDCAFCQRNAALNAVRSIPLDERKKPEALKGMFDDFYDIKRQDLPIQQNYPTHPQAEVLVFDAIPIEYIKEIHFWDATTLKNWRSNYIGTYSNKLIATMEYFTYRVDYGVWRSKNFNEDGIPLSYFSDGKSVDPDDFDDDIPF